MNKDGSRRYAHINGAFWTLADQAAISLGTFALNVQLARHLSPRDYGIVALLFGSYYLIQHVNASLIYYPLMVRLAGGNEPRPTDLIFMSTALTGAFSLIFGALLALCLCVLGHADIAAAATAYLVIWQLQDVNRRALLAEFRHCMAAASDSITYLGGAGGIAALAATGRLNTFTALCGMTAACAIALAVQIAQRRPSFPRGLEPRALVVEYWHFGKWAFVNGLVLTIGMQIFPWSLAIMHGAAAAAGFQAILNIANLANPIVFGLCNIILPATARAQERYGMQEAWRSARKYMIVGLALIAAYSIPLLCAPWVALYLLYGANSPYADLEKSLVIVVMAIAINAGAEMVYTFINGVKQSKLALRMNVWGLVATVIALPAAAAYGIVGCALLLASSRTIRLVASWLIVMRLLAASGRRPPTGPVQVSTEGSR